MHRLKVDPKFQHIKQKKQSFAPEYQKVIAKVNKLLNAGFIREATYLEWIAKLVMVKKARMMNLYRLHPFQLSVSKRWLSITKDQSDNRCDLKS